MGTRFPPSQVYSDEEFFKDFPLDKSGVDPHDMRQNPNAARNGLSDDQREIVQTLFDTQPERRKQIMKQFGFEVSADGDSYRPIDSKAEFIPIDPWFSGDSKKGFWEMLKEGGRELGRDTKELYFDVGVSGPLIVGGTTAGATAGLAAGAKLGGVVGAAAGSVVPGAGTAAGGIGGSAIGAVTGGIGGGYVGGAAGNLAAEAIKAEVGDFFLSDPEEVPFDVKLAMYQSLTTSALNLITAGGAKALSKMRDNWKAKKIDKAQNLLREAVERKSKGAFSEELAQDFVMNPQNYTPERVKSAKDEIFAISKEVFGTSVKNPHSTRELTGGIAKDEMNRLNKLADLEMEKLGQRKEANFTVDELENIIEASPRLKELRAQSFLEPDERAPVKFIDDYIADFKKSYEVKPEQSSALLDDAGKPIASVGSKLYRELTFPEGRKILKGLQNTVHNPKSPHYKDPILTDISANLKKGADDKAGVLKSDLPETNAKRSEVLSTYNNFYNTVNDSHFDNAFIARDRTSIKKVYEAFFEMDRVAGTNFTPRLKDAQFRSAIQDMNKTARLESSGSRALDALKGGLAGMASGIVRGKPIQALKGGAAGALEGFRPDPQSLMNQASKIKVRADHLRDGKKYLPNIGVAAGAIVPPASGIDVTGGEMLQNYVEPVEQQQAAFNDEEFFKDFQLDQTGIDQP